MIPRFGRENCGYDMTRPRPLDASRPRRERAPTQPRQKKKKMKLILALALVSPAAAWWPFGAKEHKTTSSLYDSSQKPDIKEEGCFDPSVKNRGPRGKFVALRAEATHGGVATPDRPTAGDVAAPDRTADRASEAARRSPPSPRSRLDPTLPLLAFQKRSTASPSRTRTVTTTSTARS